MSVLRVNWILAAAAGLPPVHRNSTSPTSSLVPSARTVAGDSTSAVQVNAVCDRAGATQASAIRNGPRRSAFFKLVAAVIHWARVWSQTRCDKIGAHESIIDSCRHRVGL